MKTKLALIPASLFLVAACLPEETPTPNTDPTWYFDGDSDGWGDPANSLTQATQPGSYVANDYDCNDASASYGPHVPETPDYEDNDCDGLVDEGSNRIFITSAMTNGDIGGVEGADAMCQAAANSSTLLSGTYKALFSGLAVPSENVMTRLSAAPGDKSAKPYYNTQNQPVAADFADLYNGGDLTNAIGFDEDGNAAAGTPWTNTQSDGFTTATLFDTTCLNFTYDLPGASQNGAIGSAGSATTWTQFTTAECDTLNPLICIESKVDVDNPGP